MSEANKAVVRRTLEELFNEGNLEIASELVTSHYVNHEPDSPDFGTGPQALSQSAALYRQAFPDLHMTVEDLVAEGDKVLLRWKATGTHQGSLGQLPSTGKQVTVTGMGLHRFENGKVAEHWGHWDQMGMLQQLGVMPPPDQMVR